MSLSARHGDHGHGHPSEDSVRQHALASLYWYVILAVLICGLLARLVSVYIARQRTKSKEARLGSDAASTVEKLFETPRAAFLGSVLYRSRPNWLAALPLRKTFLVIIYAAFISFLLTWKAIKYDEKYLERLAFRAGWITTTQTSLPFLLAARTNPIGLVLGTSYEKVNWFHRWVSRIFVLSATIHGSFFMAEWIAADFFWTELKTVGMVKWGLAAWTVLVWTLLSTWAPLRRMRYEFFVVQHIVSVLLLLGFLLLHVPSHHHFSVWCAVVAFLYDVVTRSANPIWRNIVVGFSSKGSTRYAYQAQVRAVDSEVTTMTIRNIGFNWTPGQHVLIWSSALPKQSPHPFTISSIPASDGSSSDLELVLKTKTGFTRKINDWARKSDNSGSDGTLRVLLAGPYGSMPNWRQFGNVVLVAASTGGSFTTPILQDLLSKSDGRVRKISALYIVRNKAHAGPYLRQISGAVSRAKSLGIAVRVEVAVTRNSQHIAGLHDDPANESRERLITSEPEPELEATKEGRGDSVELDRFSIDSSGSVGSERADHLLKEEMELGLNDDHTYDASSITETEGRPDIAAFLRGAVGSVPGNVAVAVCAGSPIERTVKMAVASLRKQRVSEGLGANDISLHVERTDI